ncbi:MAG: hypothetical protein RR768_10720 [Clostridium sp.]
MSRTKKFFYNAFSSMLMQVIILITGLIIPRLMLITYGSEVNGLISSISQFIGYFALVEAGLAGASIFALYKPLADKDAKAISEVVSATTKFYRTAGYIFLVLVFGLSISYPIFVKTESLNNIEVGCLVLVLSISTVLNFFAMARHRALITADQKGYVLNYLTIASTIVNTIIIVALTNIGINIVLLRVVSLISVVIAPLFLHFYVKKAYPFINYKAKPNTQALSKRWDAFILQLLNSVQTACPIVLATVFTSLKEVSVYSIFNMVIMGIMQIISIFGSGVSASFGELLAKKEYATFEKVYSEFECLTYFIMTLMLSCAMVLLMPFVTLYTHGITDVNYNQPIIGFLFVLNALLYNIKGPQGTLVSSAGLYKETKWRTLTQAIIAIIAGIMLTPTLGLAGILIGLILSNVYRDIDLIIFMPKTIGHISLLKTIKRVILLLFEFAIITVPFMFIKMDIQNYIDWIMWGSIVFIYAFIIMSTLTFIFDKTTFIALINRGLGFLKKRGKHGR